MEEAHIGIHGPYRMLGAKNLGTADTFVPGDTPMSQLVILGIGDHHASDRQDEIIRTYALGSCIALMLHHPAQKLAAMAHVALPASRFGVHRRKNNPGYYADTAIACLIHSLQSLGLNTAYGGNGLHAKLAGGANVLEKKFYDFEIGDRITQELHQLLAKHRIPIVASDTGGTISRTVSMETATGRVTVSSRARAPLYL